MRCSVITRSAQTYIAVRCPTSMSELGALPGAPFFRYLRIDVDRSLLVDHVGHPAGLVAATAELLAWTDREGLVPDVRDLHPTGQEWAARVEHYESDPATTPVERSEVRLALRLRD